MTRERALHVAVHRCCARTCAVVEELATCIFVNALIVIHCTTTDIANGASLTLLCTHTRMTTYTFACKTTRLQASCTAVSLAVAMLVCSQFRMLRGLGHILAVDEKARRPGILEAFPPMS